MFDDITSFNERPKGRQTALLWLVTVIAIILVGWALRATASVTVPIIFAFFLSLIVWPLDRMAASHLPKKLAWLGHVVALIALLLGLGLFVSCLWISAAQVVERLEGVSEMSLPSGLDLAMDKADAQSGAGTLLGEAFSSAAQSLGGAGGQWVSGFAKGVVDTVGTTLGGLVLVVFLTLLMLIEAPRWHDKLRAVSSRRAERDTQAALIVIAERIKRYLIVRTVLGLLTAGLYAVWLWFFGIDLLLVWGLLAFVMNFVPTLGSLIAGLLAVIYAFIEKDFSTALFIGSGILLIEQVMGNFVDPRMQGRQVSISPLVVLVVLVLWGWIWGVMGAILAVPVTIAAIITFSHFPALRPLALFLSNETSMEELDRTANGYK